MTPPRAQAASTLLARQVRSGICCNKRQKATLRALGLERIGRVRTLPDNDQVRGMIAKIPHLVEIVGGDRAPGRAR
ncbi:MAG: 50S ribosomal protein L30 [Acidobacteriia bacterium]|nr:50S ribosomal protein L30 [Terriglobia bacterium]